jgi:hypothetical protein
MAGVGGVDGIEEDHGDQGSEKGGGRGSEVDRRSDDGELAELYVAGQHLPVLCLKGIGRRKGIQLTDWIWLVKRAKPLTRTTMTLPAMRALVGRMSKFSGHKGSRKRAGTCVLL